MMKKFLICLVLAALAAASHAQPVPGAAKTDLPPPTLTARSWVLVDYNTGWILAQHQSDEIIEPASLTKLMTAYMVFSELKKGVMNLDDKVHVSKKAWQTGGSRMFIEVDTQVSVENLLKGLIIQSGNDAAVALAEHVAGTEEAFAARMNDTADRLGMENSNFTNAPGLPDPEHYSTARDLSILASALIREFPDYYKWYSIREFTYNDITQHNRNVLLGRDDAIDGVKTGYTQNAGYCLIGSGRKDGMRLVAVVTGTESPNRRAEEVHALLKYGFASYESKLLFDGGKAAARVPVYKGKRDNVSVAVERPLYVTVAKGKEPELKADLQLPESTMAPVSSGQPLGEVRVTLAGDALVDAPLVAMNTIDRGAWWQVALDSMLLWFR
ncbi:MAG: D-alanyl-D-alanine carboxypeptidase family protein [Gammaproteobacteria bacterium]|nr:D-alanyl-D-alanine carboxypeptidase family protein [Gammaproteobacteria bacterium]